MKRSHVALSLALPLVLACAASGHDEATSETASAIGEEQGSSPVFVLDSGHWSDGEGDGVTLESFWVDLSVRNDAYTKDAGIVWSSDGWKTSHTTHAHFKAGLGGGRERWGLDEVHFASAAGWQPAPEVEYAAFVTMNGATSWSPFRNHYVYAPVSPAHPVRLLTYSVSLGDGGTPALHGTARALNVAGDRHVVVRYTVDAWKSSHDAEAAFDGKDFRFDVPLTVAPATTEAVEFAVRFDAEGQSAWDNASGANYHGQLAPSLTNAVLANDPGRPADGWRLFSGGLFTGLPVDHVWMHVDGGPRIDVPAVSSTSAPSAIGFSPSGSFLYAFSSASLAEGAHTIAVEAAAGPFVRSFAPSTFQVAHGVAYETSSSVAPPSGAAWDFEVDARGRVFVLDEHGVQAFAGFDAAAPYATYAPSPVSYVLHDLALDAEDRAYALAGTSLVRWTDSGQVDATFGKGGALDLASGTLGTSALCYPANVAVVDERLVVVDSCNSRLVRLTLDGSFLDELSLADGTYSNVTNTFVQGTEVWVGRTVNRGSGLGQELVKVEATAGRPMSAAAPLPLDQTIQNIQSFAVTDQGAWVADFNGNLDRVDATGRTAATWLGASGDLGLAGGLGIVSHLYPAGSNEVVALSTAGSTLARFRAR